ncbi:MAG: transketolase C-terminal domain-containing protein [Candidatus Shapirobacteria bacterium]|nr:transketolase C-terminal domain-containing protein [Candidatus Shapirobacteria bacterium]MDD4410110.1 transketolase C-terminal domain-containing protein [Candidatus Shapirobacteria bacterium]
MIINSIRQSFGETLCKLAKTNKNIYVVNADLKSPLFLNNFAKKFPHRFIECGVAETNAAGVAAGLAKTGKTVFLTSFACFSPAINWNTIKQSICYNNSNVKIIGSHAGLLSTDLGATHQMLEDISLMRSLPNMEVFSPLDALETTKIIKAVTFSKKPAYIRLVRPSTPNFFDPKLDFTIGKSHRLQSGKDITIIGHGPILEEAFQVQAKLNLDSKYKKISLEIINCSSIKPLDTITILKSVKKTGRLICLEDHQQNGGLGEVVASLILSNNISCKFIHLAVDNKFGRSAKTYQELYDYYGIGINDLLSAVKKIL